MIMHPVASRRGEGEKGNYPRVERCLEPNVVWESPLFWNALWFINSLGVCHSPIPLKSDNFE